MDDEYETYEEEIVPSSRWSWWMLAGHAALFARDVLAAAAAFCEEGLADGFAAAGNRQVDMDEKRDMATDVLADLGVLP